MCVTHRDRFAIAHPNSCFARTSFMQKTLSDILLRDFNKKEFKPKDV